jgi:hypothetical protein
VSFQSSEDPAYRLQHLLISPNHTLLDLRDTFFCSNDFSSSIDHQWNSPHGTKRSASFFFIEDTFYVDSRASHEHGVDYAQLRSLWSLILRATAAQRTNERDDFLTPVYRTWVGRRPLIDWYAQAGKHMKKADAAICFRDLSLRVNHPYVFVHQGNCEHVLLIHDIR